MRRLATRIWNVAAGRVETFPGTLDEYLASSIRELRLPEEQQISRGDKTGAGQADGPSARETDRERRRREALERAQRRRVLGPIEERLRVIEEQITAIEVVQRQRTEALADPAVYADPVKGAELNRAFHEDQRRLVELNARWEEVGSELDSARAELEGNGD